MEQSNLKLSVKDGHLYLQYLFSDTKVDVNRTVTFSQYLEGKGKEFEEVYNEDDEPQGLIFDKISCEGVKPVGDKYEIRIKPSGKEKYEHLKRNFDEFGPGIPTTTYLKQEVGDGSESGYRCIVYIHETTKGLQQWTKEVGNVRNDKRSRKEREKSV